MDEAPRIASLVLAAGLSRRMGADNKLLLRLPSGRSMLGQTLAAVLAARLGPVILVTGHEAGRVAREAAGLDVRCVLAADYAQGLSASLRAGLAAVPADCAGALICLGDMPLVPAAVLRALAAAFAPRDGFDIIQPCRAGRPGNPLLWGRRHFAAMRGLRGDAGARALLAANAAALRLVPVADDGIFHDIDTAEDFRARFAP